MTRRFDAVWRSAFGVSTVAGLLLALTMFGGPARAQTHGARIAVEIGALHSSTGSVRGALYASRDGWTDVGREIATCRATIHGTHATCVFRDVAPGTYAFAFLHDEDDDGQLDRDWIGIPQEGFGFSNDAAPGLGPPSFESATFTHDAPETVIRVHARYGL